MKKILLIITILVLISALVNAQMYEVHYSLEEGLEIVDVIAAPERIGDPQTGEDLIIQQYDSQNNLLHERGFAVFGKPEQKEGENFFDFVLHSFNSVVSVHIPYISNTTTITVSFEDQEQTVSIGDFTCNRNGLCDFGENYHTCPTDCPPESDGLCNPRIDGVCDPDCGLRDPDCTEEDLRPKTLPADVTQTPTRSEQSMKEYFDSRPEPKEVNVFLITIILLALVSLIVFVVIRIRGDGS